MNTVEVVAADGGGVKVTIRSGGERDLSAVTTREDLERQLDAADATRPGEEASS